MDLPPKNLPPEPTSVETGRERGRIAPASSLISCIVPVFNGERYLEEALESILGQTYRPLQVIVVDDGSTDGTARLAAGYGQRIEYVHQPNSGHSAARNLGLDTARGEYLAFLDADDVWHPHKLARQMARFQARPQLDLSITYVQNFWMPELSTEAERFREHRRGRPLPGYSLVALLARRTTFEKVGRFETALRHSSATDWFLRAAELGAAAEMLPEVLVYRRMHNTNFSRGQASQSRDEYLSLLKTWLDRRRGRIQAATARCQDSEPGRDREADGTIGNL